MKRTFKHKMVKLSKNFARNEVNSLFYRGVFSELRFSSNIRLCFYYKLIRLQAKKPITKFNYFCPETDKNRGVLHFFNVYRMKFRENVSFGAYSGIRKSSW